MLKTTILNVLLVCHRAGGRMLPLELLRSECNLQLADKPGDGEFLTALDDLVAKDYVDSIRSDLTGDRKYFITEKGRAQL